jgi:hypothetical protein
MMKKLFIIMTILFIISSVDARMLKRSLIEIGPKASLYINGDIQFGIGIEVVVNPLRSIGFRLDLTEIRFDPTTFHFNRKGALDAFIYLPMKGLQLYVHSGIGLKIHETGAGTQTHYSIQGGLGLNYPLNQRTTLFAEPGIIISGNDETDVSFRVSAGGRFGIIK